MSPAKLKPDPKLQQTIDQLLMDHGEYSPVELLLAESRLLYSDYEAWLNGDIEYLEDVLFGDPEHIKIMLQQTQAYVEQLPRLSAQSSSPAGLRNTPNVKHFSRDLTLDNIFKTRYQKADDQPQMDLFLDGGAGNLINGIILELANNDFTAARSMLEKLYDTQPDNTRLNDLEALVQYGEQSRNTPADIAAQMDYLHNPITALAHAQMAQRAREYLVPQWRRLTKALSGVEFDHAHPNLHASYTAIQALDWNTARQAIEHESQWRNNPLLLQRHIHACSRLWQINDALLGWFYLCWKFPQDTDIDAAPVDKSLKCDWLEFQDLEPELHPGVFPSWYILNKPGLVKTLPDPSGEVETPCDATYKIVHRMLTAQLSGSSILPQLDITLRQELRAADPDFFQHFINRIGS